MKRLFLIAVAFIITGIAGCKKDYLNQEVNPNNPSGASLPLLLAGALNNSTNIVSTGYPGYMVWAGYAVTSGNYVPNATINQYQITNTSFNGTWTNWYATLANFNTIQQAASKDASQANFQAIAMIMKAYGFQHLVDQFGDVPYTQAFQPSTILFPAYDKGTDIYEDLGKQLDAAIALIHANGSAASPGTSDIVFNGDMTGWLRFANSVKLRLAMRVSGTTGTGSDPLITDLASTAADGYLDATHEAIANPGYQNLTGKQNPIYGGFVLDANGNPGGTGVYYRANAFIVNTLNSTGDPRAEALFNLVPPPGSPAGTPATQVRGNIFGDNSSNNLTNNYTSTYAGAGVARSSSQGQPLFSGSESLFLQAEAANRGIISGDAKALYQAGITASFEELGLTDAQAAAYYAQALNDVNWDASADKEQAIITQKWIALSINFPFEGWNEFRRTGFPAVPASIDPAKVLTNTPYRVLYPLSELTTNTANLAKEGNIDPSSSKIFWMK
ncbi:MAG: SusD/RagB family nutrient-binding outer membrane lipoprotein [Mucilaginibacter sp.]